MKRKLTDLSVSRMKPPASGRVDVWDQHLPNFGVRVMPSGVKTWIVGVRRPNGQHSRISIGHPGSMSLADARKKARQLLGDPSLLVKREQAKADTVAAVVALYIQRYQKPRNRSWQRVERVLTSELKPWAARPISDIKRRDVIALLDDVADRAPFSANRLRAFLRHLFAWALERDLVEASPVAAVKPPAKEVRRDRVLTPDELAAVWRACDPLGWPFGPLFRLLIVTGARRDEIAALRWSDVDLERREITIPAERYKTKIAHTIPLSDLALEIIETLPRFVNDGGLVFPARRAASTSPVSGFSMVKRRLDKVSGVTGWRLHDIRRRVATGLQRLGERLEVTEAVLGHVSGSRAGVVGIYQRYDFASDKRQALDKWSREVERMLGRGEQKVVELPRKTA